MNDWIDYNGDGKFDPMEIAINEINADDDSAKVKQKNSPPTRNTSGAGCGCLTTIATLTVIAAIVAIALLA